LVEKDKPLTYMETHSGRGLYDLNSTEAQKNKEFESGIEWVLKKQVISENEPYIKAILDIRKFYGRWTYPGSPKLGGYFLRDCDSMHFMELHPQEIVYLRKNMEGPNVHIHHRDGYEGVLGISPPTPRRGMVLIDPSYEVKEEYSKVVGFIEKLHRKWPEAVIVLWYPLFTCYYEKMKERILDLNLKDTYCNEVVFGGLKKEARDVYGSGMLVVNCPFGSEEKMEACKRLLNNRCISLV